MLSTEHSFCGDQDHTNKVSVAIWTPLYFGGNINLPTRVFVTYAEILLDYPVFETTQISDRVDHPRGCPTSADTGPPNLTALLCTHQL